MEKTTKQDKTNTNQERDLFEKLLSEDLKQRKFSEGEIANAVISEISNKYVFVDLGLKSEGAIPIEEFDRLKKKFIEYNSTNFKKPEIIILEKLEPLTQKIVIKKQNYCKLYDGNIYILYSKKNPETECIL